MLLRQNPRVDCEMTVGIAGFTSTRQFVVTVSDARLSHGEIIPAADDATMKNRRIAGKWGMMFAAQDSSAFIPVLTSVQETLQFTGSADNPNFNDVEVKKAALEAYEKEFNERFFREHLARWGFSNVQDFRKNGFAELGKDLYGEYADKLAKFDLGLELLIYGYGNDGFRHLFEVANPGKVVSHNLRGFAAIGSGSWMALAALNRKPVAASLADTIYRLLDAKFSSETASGVGRRTHIIIMSSDGKYGGMSVAEIDKIRAIWEETLKQPEPDEALDLILKTKGVKAVYDGEP
jgi:20S proteasome alpha/beta subunit